MLFFNIIFAITCYPILFIMYFMLRNAKDKNSWCFGATLSRELKMDSAVEAIDAEYRKNMKSSLIVLGIVPIAAFFTSYMSIAFSIWMYWILVVCFLPMFFLAKANKQIQDLKSIRHIKKKYPELLVIADVCLCEYTSHGHCGLVEGCHILNDETLPLLAKMSVTLAEAGAGGP